MFKKIRQESQKEGGQAVALLLTVLINQSLSKEYGLELHHMVYLCTPAIRQLNCPYTVTGLPFVGTDPVPFGLSHSKTQGSLHPLCSWGRSEMCKTLEEIRWVLPAPSPYTGKLQGDAISPEVLLLTLVSWSCHKNYHKLGGLK